MCLPAGFLWRIVKIPEKYIFWYFKERLSCCYFLCLIKKLFQYLYTHCFPTEGIWRESFQTLVTFVFCSSGRSSSSSLRPSLRLSRVWRIVMVSLRLQATGNDQNLSQWNNHVAFMLHVHLHARGSGRTWSAGAGRAAASAAGRSSPSPRPAPSGCAGTAPPSCSPPPRPHSAAASASASSESSGERMTAPWLVRGT